jgi:pre-mRNA-splicing helicase BRR2
MQALWDKDSPLLQLPHFTKELAAKCTAAGTASVFDVIDLEDAQRRELLAMSEQQLTDVASVCNRWVTEGAHSQSV